MISRKFKLLTPKRLYNVNLRDEVFNQQQMSVQEKSHEWKQEKSQGFELYLLHYNTILFLRKVEVENIQFIE